MTGLEILWFVLVAVLWTGFLFLEGFDFGVGVWQYFLARDDRERRAMVASIGPHWDGNEVWLLTAGGAIFAAFPYWYASLFSALYIPFVLLLLALIVRGVCFEFRGRSVGAAWRQTFDIALMVGSLLPAILVGVALADLLVGIPIDRKGNFVGTFWDLVQPTALLAGIASLALFLSHGAQFLSLKIEGELAERALAAAKVCAWISVAAFAAFGVAYGVPSVAGIAGLVCLVLAAVLLHRERNGMSFVFTGLGIALAVAALFTELFPNVLVSSLSPENNLTIASASSSPYTLKVMSIVAACLVPLVLAYQIWSYWVFRKRISPRTVE